jgi:C-terminal processing protease CtpA/Prc
MSIFSTGVMGYPGVFKMSKILAFGADNPDFYKGKVAIIVNEDTQSTGEFFAMYIKTLPNAIVVGSETAGADGNVTSIFALPGGFYTQFTGLGVYYPDGKPTQQIGIVPDVRANQTIKGYISGKDELLDKAVEVLSKL